MQSSGDRLVAILEKADLGLQEGSRFIDFVDDKPAKKVNKGMVATIRVPEKVRRNDKVYVFREREDWQS